MDARQKAGLTTEYEAQNVSVYDYVSAKPRVRYEKFGPSAKSCKKPNWTTSSTRLSARVRCLRIATA